MPMDFVRVYGNHELLREVWTIRFRLPRSVGLSELDVRTFVRFLGISELDSFTHLL